MFSPLEPERPITQWTDLWYRRGTGSSIVEVHPTVCRHGHPLSPGQSVSGWHPGGYRTVGCNLCYAADLPDHNIYLKSASGDTRRMLDIDDHSDPYTDIPRCADANHYQQLGLPPP